MLSDYVSLPYSTLSLFMKTGLP